MLTKFAIELPFNMKILLITAMLLKHNSEKTEINHAHK